MGDEKTLKERALELGMKETATEKDIVKAEKIAQKAKDDSAKAEAKAAEEAEKKAAKGKVKIICPKCKKEILAKNALRSCVNCNVRMMTIPVYNEWVKSLKKK